MSIDSRDPQGRVSDFVKAAGSVTLFIITQVSSGFAVRIVVARVWGVL
jgi:hypothetical protein